MKKRNTLIVITLLTAALTFMVSGCGKQNSGLAVESDGSYSFTGNGSNYVLQVFEPEDIVDGEPVSGKETLSSTNITGGSGEVAGTLADIENIPFGDYKVLLYSIDANYDKILADEIDFSKTGKLSAPEFSYTIHGFDIEAELTGTSIEQYMAGEMLTSYTIQIFDNENCTGEPIAQADMDGTAIEKEVDNSGYDSQITYYNNVTELNIDGTVGEAQTIYIKAVANADVDGYAQESDETTVTEITTDGKYTLRKDAAVPQIAESYANAANYECTGIEYTKQAGMMEETVNKAYRLEISADGTYMLYEKDLSSENAEFAEVESGSVQLADTYFLYFTYMGSDEKNPWDTEPAEETERVAQGYFNNNLNEITMQNPDGIEITLILQ